MPRFRGMSTRLRVDPLRRAYDSVSGDSGRDEEEGALAYPAVRWWIIPDDDKDALEKLGWQRVHAGEPPTEEAIGVLRRAVTQKARARR